jgi:hypothetical protein
MSDDRFQVFHSKDLPEGFHEFVWDGYWALCEVLDGKIIRVVGADGGWVVAEMNRLYRLYEEAHKQTVAFAIGSGELHRQREKLREALENTALVTFDLKELACPLQQLERYNESNWCAVDPNITCESDQIFELPKACPLRSGSVTVRFEEKKDGGENRSDELEHDPGR